MLSVDHETRTTGARANKVGAASGFDFGGSHVPTCLECGGPMRLAYTVPADCKKGAPNRFNRVYACEASGYARVSPPPSPSDVLKFYELDRYYTQGKSHFAEPAKITFLDRVREHLAWRGDRGEPLTAERIHAALPRAGADVIDVGCGDGAVAKLLAELGHRVVGVDVDKRALGALPNERFQFFEGSAEVLPDGVKTRRFDLVLMRHVLEHCIDPNRALENARALLKPGGILFCEVPNHEAEGRRRSGIAWEMFDVPRHLHFFTRRSLESFVKRAGFTVDRSYFSCFSRQLTNIWIDTERELWKNAVSTSVPPSPMPVRNSRARAWLLFLSTVFAQPERKYDSVGLLAIRSG